jgi:serine/threonine-protein kinase RsbT
VPAEHRVVIETDADIVVSRQAGRELAATLNFSSSDLTVIAAAISELARNIYKYAGKGEIRLSIAEGNGRRGIRIVAADNGPGIVDVDLAMQDGYSTSGSLGLGLPGVRRLMDEFELHTSTSGRTGTTVTMCKWAR